MDYKLTRKLLIASEWKTRMFNVKFIKPYIIAPSWFCKPQYLRWMWHLRDPKTYPEGREEGYFPVSSNCRHLTALDYQTKKDLTLRPKNMMSLNFGKELDWLDRLFCYKEAWHGVEEGALLASEVFWNTVWATLPRKVGNLLMRYEVKYLISGNKLIFLHLSLKWSSVEQNRQIHGLF